jgi:hypothetical protein
MVRRESQSPPYQPEPNAVPPPQTPETSPPNQQQSEMSGGERDFQVGGIVYLRGGKKANTPYSIIKKGDKFLTIESMDPTNYEDEAIQVVLPFELLKPEEYTEAAPFMEDPFAKPLLTQPQRMRDMAPQDGQGIVFAPVIKIVNGNDNSTNDEPEKPKQPNDYDKFSTPLIKQEEPKKELEVKKTKEPVSSSSSGGGGGILDFAKDFIIKKLT